MFEWVVCLSGLYVGVGCMFKWVVRWMLYVEWGCIKFISEVEYRVCVKDLKTIEVERTSQDVWRRQKRR